MKTILLLLCLFVTLGLYSQNSVWIRLETEPKLLNQKWTLGDAHLDEVLDR